MTTYDTIVIGAGAMGSATCYQLARRGIQADLSWWRAAQGA